MEKIEKRLLQNVIAFPYGIADRIVIKKHVLECYILVRRSLFYSFTKEYELHHAYNLQPALKTSVNSAMNFDSNSPSDQLRGASSCSFSYSAPDIVLEIVCALQRSSIQTKPVLKLKTILLHQSRKTKIPNISLSSPSKLRSFG
ncbi:hypothetical protein O181_015869 [Austropuccinia psidii MF-1]|uniref:Uncharacterized protein n=1 Tax=Austropuccinia psidii MF-1 TaxID=1389203 RepID=A0A9Q3GR87_9BASI|nr:hypothetical protein [Austropuccinia psidii MF-1]